MNLKPSLKGMFGEFIIRLTLRLFLNKNKYKCLHNITLPLADGGTTQIDHIIVSAYGIFVIETKNYNGWIFGNEKHAVWTQMFANGKKFRFQNPIRQNYLHLKTLARLLNLSDKKFHSMVVFVGSSKLKTKKELPDSVMRSGWIRHIKKHKKVILTDFEVNELVEKIYLGKLDNSVIVNKQHKKHVEKKINSKSNISHEVTGKKVKKTVEYNYSNLHHYAAIEDKSIALSKKNIESSLGSEVLCPRCSSAMVKRLAKQGKNRGNEFWGCSQFPVCRGTRVCS